MATVVSPIIEPDTEAMAAHLALLFEPCMDEYPGGLVEIAHGSDKDPAPTLGNLFPVTRDGLAEAVAYAVAQNNRGANVYVGVNPRRPQTADNRRAAARDVEIAFWQFADIDKKEALDQAGWHVLKPSAIVLTGTRPNLRPHLYWKLEEPTSNMAAWTEQQKAIAAALGGDHVINPDRIMRLAGSVNFPTFKKREERGYAVELTTLQDKSEDRGPFTFGQLSHAFPRVEQVFDEVPRASDPMQSGDTTLSAMARSKAETLIAQCRAGDQWHNAMIALVAHLAAIGTPSPVILGLASEITLSGYAVDDTRREMRSALHGARVKFGIPEPDEEAAADAAKEQRESTFTLLDIDELEAMPSPVYIVEDLLTETGFAVLYGDPGSGKSFVALDIALRLAHGMDWHGKATKRTGVLYIAGEGHAGLGKRVKGWRREHAMEGIDAPFLLLPEAVQMLEDGDVAKLLRTIDVATERAGFAIGLTVIDTVSRALTGADENSQDSMSKFVHSCAIVQRHIQGAALGVHHTGKDASKGMRGSTVLIGACDTSIRCEGDLQEFKTVTLTVEKQKDGEQLPPLRMGMKEIEWSAGLAKPVTTLVPLVSEAETPSFEPMKKGLSKAQSLQVLEDCNKRFAAKSPMTNSPRMAGEGRYLPRIISKKYDIGFDDAKQLVQGWIDEELLVSEVYETRAGKKGLKAPNIPQDWSQGSQGSYA